MKDLIRLYLDPAATETIGGAILESFDAPAETPIETPKETPAETPKSKFAWGDEDRRKNRDEDPEFDLGYEDEKDGVKTPAKARLSHIRETAKFLKENGKVIQSAMGMREEFNKNPDLAKAFNTFWAKAYEGNKYNPEAVAKLSSMLEGKAEATKDKIEEQTDDIKEMETLINELDADSPQAKILRQNINGLKATRAQLKEALGTIKTLQDKTDGHDKFRTGFEETQKKQKEDADAKQASDLFKTEFGALTSKDNKQGYQFEDQDDAREFEGAVRDVVANQAAAGKINSDEEFTKAIREAAKASFEKISRRNEKIVNDYLRKKGQLPKVKEEEKPKEGEKDPYDGKSIGDIISESMFPSAG